jgi:hypothetical protein
VGDHLEDAVGADGGVAVDHPGDQVLRQVGELARDLDELARLGFGMFAADCALK